jgi:hypothetical protein
MWSPALWISDLPDVAAAPGLQRFDVGDPALMLGDSPRAALVRDAEEDAFEIARDRSRSFARSCTPAVSSGACADTGAGAPCRVASRKAVRASVRSRACAPARDLRRVEEGRKAGHRGLPTTIYTAESLVKAIAAPSYWSR